MESISRNVIIDLLPAYIAGEVSEESKTLIEKFAEDDLEIAEIIRSGKLDFEPIPANTVPSDDLEMKTIRRVRQSIRRQVLMVGIGTACLLMIPLIAMFFTKEVNWGLLDFVVMGILLFGAGLTYVMISKAAENYAYRFAAGIAVAGGLLLIWMNLAVGIIGAEGNPANFLYLAVIASGIIGTVLSKLQSSGMAKTMFATAVIQMMVPATALIIWKPAMEASPGVFGVFLINIFFAVLFAVSGLLFRKAAVADSEAK